jgi:hypothetical protein
MITTIQTDSYRIVMASAWTLPLYDPFQLAMPCWQQRVYHQLPPETQTTVVRLTPQEEIKIMAIRTVAATAAPARIHVRGGISSKSDYVDVLNALNAPTFKADQALIVDMDAKSWVKQDNSPIPKAELVFAGSLTRRFTASGVPVIAYMSGNMQVTVRRLTALEQKERTARKKR